MADLKGLHNKSSSDEQTTDDFSLKLAAIAQEHDRPKYKSEAYLTSGLGYGKKKQELLGVFWSIVWPKLAAIGWVKTESTPNNPVTCLIFPPGITRENGKKGRDYHDRIRTVIQRLLERQDGPESEIADALSEAQSKLVTSQDKETGSALRKRLAAESAPEVTVPTRCDLSWKDGGNVYPKKSSRVGDAYQAVHLPPAGSHELEENMGSEKYCDQIWDSSKGKEKQISDFLADRVPYNKKEQMLPMIHESEYKVSDAMQKLSMIEPADGSNWTSDEKQKFNTEIFRLRKNLKHLSKVMGKSMESCIAYYLGTFKKSDHYRILKTVCVEGKDNKAALLVHGVDECAVCGDGGSLIICDSCEGEYHMSCLSPPLQIVPEGSWDCDECVNRKFVAARNRIIKLSSLYEQIDSTSKKQKVEGSTNNDASQTIAFRPTEFTQEKAKAFAINISKLLSGG